MESKMEEQHYSNGAGKSGTLTEMKEVDGKLTEMKEMDLEEGNYEKEGNIDVKEKPRSLEFGIEARPPIYLTLILAVQVIMAIIGGPMGIAFVIYSFVCADGNDLVLSQLINTSVFMVGISTFLQTTIGVRLPIIQGSSFTYFIPVMTMLRTAQWKCPDRMINITNEDFSMNASYIVNPLENLEEPWKPRLAAVSGSLAVASILHILLGATGMVGFLLRYVGPLTITPTVGMIGLMLYEAINVNAQYQWGIAYGTVVLIVIFSQFMKNITVPLCSSGKGKTQRTPVFKLFSSAIATILMWILCIILTAAGAFPDDPTRLAYKARSDARINVVSKSAWIYVPYPGQWGPITIDPATVGGMLGAVFSSTIESIGDYYATARVCEVAAPPKHAVNRGILTEGICSLLSGLFGAAHATTSYSSVMGFISYTGNASRLTWQVASVILIIFGVFGKFGAALALVPQPIIGGLMAVNLGMCFSIALTNIKLIDIESSRNQMVLALAFVFGISMPMCVKDYPESLQTGVYAVDQAIHAVCSNALLMAGLTGFFLDNIVPGTRKERGMAVLDEISLDDIDVKSIKRLSYTPYQMRIFTFLSQFRIVKYIPFLPDKSDTDREVNHKAVPSECT